jgi:hypothetical protein
MKKLVRLVASTGFKKVGSPTGGKFSLESKDGYRIDLFQARTEHDAEAVKRSRTFHVFGVDILVVSPEDLILQKLFLRRPKDITDSMAVLIRQRGNLDIEYMTEWASNLNLSGELRELMKRVK